MAKKKEKELTEQEIENIDNLAAYQADIDVAEEKLRDYIEEYSLGVELDTEPVINFLQQLIVTDLNPFILLGLMAEVAKERQSLQYLLEEQAEEAAA